MLKKIVTAIIMAIVVTIGTMGTGQAKLREPDVVYYGTAISASNASTIAIKLNGSSAPVASCSVGSNRSYVLRVPMDAFDPRLPGTARTGEVAAITIDGVQAGGTVVIPGRGSLVKLDLGAQDAAQWAKDHPGDDGSGDMNRNGITDKTEYLSGKDPAGCVWSLIDGSHAESTVYHPEVLKNCLKEAGNDGKHNTIRVTRGSYAGNFSYQSQWGEAFGLTLIGGYDPAGSGPRTADPSLTILDGSGNGIVLTLDTDTNKTFDKVRVESLTLNNGTAPTGQKGGGIQARIYQGGLELVGNIISNSNADSGGGLSLESSDSGSIFLANNIIYGNSAANAAAARIVPSGSGYVTLLNNTVADNIATSAGDGRTILIESSTAPVDLTNNIISTASGLTGSDIYINSSGVAIPLTVTHNAFDAVNGLLVNASGFILSASNIGDAPQFSGNYRLSPASTLINKGTSHLKLPATDVVGETRTLGAAVDLGAYEFVPILNTLTVAVGGTGIGTVTSDPGGITCNKGTTSATAKICTKDFSDTVNLYATPSVLSTFGGWGDSCSGLGTCSVIMSVAKTVTATFNSSATLQIGVIPYATLQEAYNAADSDDIIKLLDNTVAGTLNANKNISVTLKGGYDAVYSVITGTTAVTGPITIRRGTVVIDRIVIK